MIKRNSNRKLTLESRIARLENVLRSNSCSVKNESLDLDEDLVAERANILMNDVFADSYYWGTDKKGTLAFMHEFEKMAEGNNPKMLKELINEIADDLDVSPRALRKYTSVIADAAAEAANGVLEAYYDPDDIDAFIDEVEELGISPNELPPRGRAAYLDFIGSNECSGSRCESRRRKFANR